MDEKIKRAVQKYMTLRGWEFVDEIDGYLIAFDQDDNAIVVVKYDWAEDGWHCEPMSREDFEHVSLKFFMSNDDYKDVVARHDIIDLHVFKQDRTFVRHVVDALNRGECDVNI